MKGTSGLVVAVAVLAVLTLAAVALAVAANASSRATNGREKRVVIVMAP